MDSNGPEVEKVDLEVENQSDLLVLWCCIVQPALHSLCIVEKSTIKGRIFKQFISHFFLSIYFMFWNSSTVKPTIDYGDDSLAN